MEQKLINWVREKYADSSIPIGIGCDDAAAICISGKELLISSDMLIENTHFSSSEKPLNIGKKAAAVSLSDMAAMGAVPLYLLVSLGVPKNYSFLSVKKIYRGLDSLLRAFNVKLIGGDTVRSPHVVIDVTVIGINKKGSVLKRSGAKKDDLIFATGYYGRSYETGWHYRFIPRIKEMQFLKGKIRISSAIDASDGLYASLRILSMESKTAFKIDCSKIKIRKKGRSFMRSLEHAFFDGEDFEMVFTGKCSNIKKVSSDFKKKFGIPLAVIGSVHKGKDLHFFNGFGEKLTIKNKEYRHFD